MSTAHIARLRERAEKARRELNEANRKLDTRKKIILGSCILSAVKDGFLHNEWVTKLLNKYVTRQSDREIFDLPPLQADSDNNSTEHHNNSY